MKQEGACIMNIDIFTMELLQKQREEEFLEMLNSISLGKKRPMLCIFPLINKTNYCNCL